MAIKFILIKYLLDSDAVMWLPSGNRRREEPSEGADGPSSAMTAIFHRGQWICHTLTPGQTRFPGIVNYLGSFTRKWDIFLLLRIIPCLLVKPIPTTVTTFMEYVYTFSPKTLIFFLDSTPELWRVTPLGTHMISWLKRLSNHLPNSGNPGSPGRSGSAGDGKAGKYPALALQRTVSSHKQLGGVLPVFEV
jgi:hypothetical protein